MYTICKRITFESAHRLYLDNLSEEENKEKFGKCSNKPCHGHSYKLYLHLKSNELNDGMVVNFSDVKKVANEKIINKWDHHFLNDILPFLTTAENMCRFIFDELKKDIKELYKVELWETETCFATYEE